MTIDQQIRINQLLLERERWFVRIHEIERAAATILGEPYPFTRGPLPSELKVKRKPGGGAAKIATAAESLRRLEPGETGYRVVYRQLGGEVTEEHDNLAALRALVAAQGADLQVRRLETTGADGGVVAVLFAEMLATVS